MNPKRQQTLSAFFRKPTNPLGADQRQDLIESRDFELPDPKRQKLVSEAIAAPSRGTIHREEADDNAKHFNSLSSIKHSPKLLPVRSPVTQRTSQYIFSEPDGRDDVPTSTASDPRREELHSKFVRKLGKPNSINDIKRRNRTLFEEQEEWDELQEEEDYDHVESEPRVNGKTQAKKTPTKLTPMEKQVIEIKTAHMDTLLVVEVGYKFKFFGEDARHAAKELGIVCIPGKMRFDDHPSEAHLERFASASIPVHRLHVHVKRLVAAGFKVGVVRQIETAALKAVGDNRNTPFTRKLTNLYTKGTYVDEVGGASDEASCEPDCQLQSTGFMLCMTESNAKGYGNDEKVNVGIVAVQPATGEVIYDNFEDGFMRSEIETRLLHIAPVEFLIVGDLSRATEKLIEHLSGSKTNVFADKARVERLEKPKTIAAEAHDHVSQFYSPKLTSPDDVSLKAFEKILGLPEHVIICLSSLIKHLTTYGLSNIFDLTKYFQPFSARSHMLLNGNTLNSLEIYQNQTDYTTRGSLLWTLDRTKTRFGSRLLRKWVGRPLLDRRAIEARLDAVQELLNPEKNIPTGKLQNVLNKTKVDLEKSLVRVYYGRCTRSELLHLLQGFQILAREYPGITAETGFSSPLLSSAIHNLSTIEAETTVYLGKINLHSAKVDDKYNFFREEHETDDVTGHKLGLASIEHDLDNFRRAASDTLGWKKPVEYVSVAGIDFLVEVDNHGPAIKKVPASWAKISGTKKCSRFHPPEVIKLVRERDQHKEALAAACDIAYEEFLKDISIRYQNYRDAVLSLATLDCLMSLATIAQQPGYNRPIFVDNSQIVLDGARHPMIEQLLIDSYVPNSISLSSGETRALLITGPNMGGKSSYVRSVALIAIMAQIGSFVPADSAILGIVDAVFTRMGAFDNMMAGESTFMVELSETSDILKFATSKSLVVLDELGRGTSTHDGVAIAGSVLDWLVRQKKCFVLFITHYQVLAQMAGAFDGALRNVHMKFSEDCRGGDNVTFLYEVGEGVAHRSYGLNVARLAGLETNVIELARLKSSELENRTKQSKIQGISERLSGQNETNDIGSSLDALVDAIDLL